MSAKAGAGTSMLPAVNSDAKSKTSSFKSVLSALDPEDTLPFIKPRDSNPWAFPGHLALLTPCLSLVVLTRNGATMNRIFDLVSNDTEVENQPVAVPSPVDDTELLDAYSR